MEDRNNDNGDTTPSSSNIIPLTPYNPLPPSNALINPSLGLYANYFPLTDTSPENVLSASAVTQGYYEKPLVDIEIMSACDIVLHHLQESKGKPLQDLGDLARAIYAHKEKLQNNAATNNADTSSPVPFNPPHRVLFNDVVINQWMNVLADNNVPLKSLGNQGIPQGMRGEKILDLLTAKRVPFCRAVWLIKCIGLAEIKSPTSKSLINIPLESRATKFSHEWSNICTTHLKEQLTEAEAMTTIASESSISSQMLPPIFTGASISSTYIDPQRRRQFLDKWAYSLKLFKWQHDEGLLEPRQISVWLIDTFRSSSLSGTCLLLPIMTFMLPDMLRSRKLAQRLVSAIITKRQRWKPFHTTTKFSQWLYHTLGQFLEYVLAIAPDTFIMNPPMNDKNNEYMTMMETLRDVVDNAHITWLSHAALDHGTAVRLALRKNWENVVCRNEKLWRVWHHGDARIATEGKNPVVASTDSENDWIKFLNRVTVYSDFATLHVDYFRLGLPYYQRAASSSSETNDVSLQPLLSPLDSPFIPSPIFAQTPITVTTPIHSSRSAKLPSSPLHAHDMTPTIERQISSLCKWAISSTTSTDLKVFTVVRILKQYRDFGISPTPRSTTSLPKASSVASISSSIASLSIPTSFQQASSSKTPVSPHPLTPSQDSNTQQQHSRTQFLQTVFVQLLDDHEPTLTTTSPAFQNLTFLFGELIQSQLFSYQMYMQRLISRGKTPSSLESHSNSNSTGFVKYLESFPIFVNQDIEKRRDTLNFRKMLLSTSSSRLSMSVNNVKRPSYGLAGGNFHNATNTDIDDPGVNTYRKVQEWIRTRLADLFPGDINTHGDSITGSKYDSPEEDDRLSRLDDSILELINSLTRFWKRKLGEWMLDAVKNYVMKASISLENFKNLLVSPGSSLLNIRQFTTILYVLETSREYHVLIELCLWVLKKTNDHDLVDMVVDTVERLVEHIWMIGRGNDVFEGLWTAHTMFLQKGNMNKRIVAFLYSIAHNDAYKLGGEEMDKTIKTKLTEHMQTNESRHLPSLHIPTEFPEIWSLEDTSVSIANVASLLSLRYYSSRDAVSRIIATCIKCLRSDLLRSNVSFVNMFRRVELMMAILKPFRELQDREWRLEDVVMELINTFYTELKAFPGEYERVVDAPNVWVLSFLMSLVTSKCISLEVLLERFISPVWSVWMTELSQRPTILPECTSLFLNTLVLTKFLFGYSSPSYVFGPLFLKPKDILSLQTLRKSFMEKDSTRPVLAKLLTTMLEFVFISERSNTESVFHQVTSNVKELRFEVLESRDSIWKQVLNRDTDWVFKNVISPSFESDSHDKSKVFTVIWNLCVNTVFKDHEKGEELQSLAVLETALNGNDDIDFVLPIRLWVFRMNTCATNDEAITNLAESFIQRILKFITQLESSNSSQTTMERVIRICKELNGRLGLAVLSQLCKRFETSWVCFDTSADVKLDPCSLLSRLPPLRWQVVREMIITVLFRVRSDAGIADEQSGMKKLTSLSRTLLEQMKWFIGNNQVWELMELTNSSMERVNRVLADSKGDVNLALDTLSSGNNQPNNTNDSDVYNLHDATISVQLRLEILFHMLPTLCIHAGEHAIIDWIPTLTQFLTTHLVTRTCPYLIEPCLDSLVVLIDNLPENERNTLMNRLRDLQPVLQVERLGMDMEELKCCLERILPFKNRCWYLKELKQFGSANSTTTTTMTASANMNSKSKNHLSRLYLEHFRPWEWIEDWWMDGSEINTKNEHETKRTLSFADTPISLAAFGAKVIEKRRKIHRVIV